MSLRRFIPLPSFGSFSAGGTATCNLPVGARKYFTILVKYKTGVANQAAMETACPRIRLLVNGKAQREFTAAELFKINALRGHAFVTGHLVIFLGLPELRTYVGEELYGWGTANVDTLTLEIDVDAGEASPSFTAQAECEDSLENLGAIIKWKRYPGKVASGAGDLPIMDLPKGIGAYWALHLFGQYITDVEVKVDDHSIMKSPRTQLAAMYAQKFPALTMQANSYSVVFPFSQQGDQILPMVKDVGGVRRPVQDLMVVPTLSQAETFNVLAEIVGSAD